MPSHPVHCLDLDFQGQPRSVASYMLEHSGGVAIVESGPGSTLGALEAALKTHGYGIHNITHVLLTHIHLDHAGASGYLAQQGAQFLSTLLVRHTCSTPKNSSPAPRASTATSWTSSGVKCCPSRLKN